MWRTGMLPDSITPIDFVCLLIILVAIISLAVPLVSYVNIILARKIKLRDDSSRRIKNINDEKSATNYSVPPDPLLTSASPELSVIHLTYPTPVNKSSEEEVISCKNNEDIDATVIEEIREDKKDNMKYENSRRSVLVSYNSYRHKLIEETLQKQYGGGYAPGNVILNLIQLNTADSSANCILDDKYDGISFFDDIKMQTALCESDSIRNVKNDLEFPDPLDHFIPKLMRKVSMTETQTETANPSEISVALKGSILPSSTGGPDAPTSCQKIIPKRSCEANYNSNKKSPFPTPVNSQAPLNCQLKSEFNFNGRTEVVQLLQNVVRVKENPVLTEQLYRRNDAINPDVVSKTHVEAEEYLNRIVKNRRFEIPRKETMIQEPRIRSSLKKSRQPQSGGANTIRKSTRDDRKNLSTSKPTIWNN